MQNHAPTPLPRAGYAVAPELRTLVIDAIVVDRAIHPRDDVHLSEVALFTRLLREGLPLPPLAAFFDGEIYLLSDGFHRLAAYLAEGRHKATVEVHLGTRRDAIVYAITSNAKHGLRLTNDEKRTAVRTLLADPDWSVRSDREIARACNCSHPMVRAIRKQLTGNSTSDDVRMYRNRHGNWTPMRIAGLRSKGSCSSDPVNTNIADEPYAEEVFDTQVGNLGRLLGRGSLQPRNLLAGLRDGQSITDAAETAGISLHQAGLHAKADEEDEYADISLIPTASEQSDPFSHQTDVDDLDPLSKNANNSTDCNSIAMPWRYAASMVEACEALIVKLGDPRYLADEIIAVDEDDVRQRFGEFLDWCIAAGEYYMTRQGFFDSFDEEASDEY